MEALLGALPIVRAKGGEGWTWLSTQKKNFSRQPVTHAHFSSVREGLRGLRMLEEVGAITDKSPFSEKFYPIRRWAPRFRATSKLTLFAETHGFTPPKPEGISTSLPRQKRLLGQRSTTAGLQHGQTEGTANQMA